MKLGQAILFTCALYALSSLVFIDTWGARVRVSWLMVVGTSIWMEVDSSRIQLRRYQSDIAVRPWSLFFGSVLLWAVVFPWYLSVRHQIMNGTAKLKDEGTQMPV